jgi:hypothetical protein
VRRRVHPAAVTSRGERSPAGDYKTVGGRNTGTDEFCTSTSVIEMGKTHEAVRAHQVVSSEIADLHARFTPHGLPEDILVCAFGGYGSIDLHWPRLKAKAQDFHRYVTAHVDDCTIRHILRRPRGGRVPAASVSIFRLMAANFRHPRRSLVLESTPSRSGLSAPGFSELSTHCALRTIFISG